MEEFVITMRHEDGSKIATPEQMQTWMKQTMDWIFTIAIQGKFVSGTVLPFDDAKVVKFGHLVINESFEKTRETIGGL